MLQEWSPPEEFVTDVVGQELERRLDGGSILLARAGLEAFIESIENSTTYKIRIETKDAKSFVLPAGVEMQCWPASLPCDTAAKSWQADQPLRFNFSPVSFEALTSFFAFNLAAKSGSRRMERQFVLNLPLHGEPGDRRTRILKSLLKDKNQVLRFILFLLSEAGGDPTGLGELLGGDGENNGDAGGIAGLSGCVWETLLHTLEREPGRLKHIHSLITDLSESEESKALLPDGFMEIWKPVWDACPEAEK